MAQIGDKGESGPYVALIGDMVASRDLPDRAGAQARLADLVEELNRDPAGALASPADMTAGDEVQALLEPGPAFLEVIVAISEGLHPVRFSFGVGFGALSTPPGPPTPLLDGPCFHHARAAVEDAAKGGSWVRARGFGEADPVIDGLFRLMQEIRDGWTETQVKYVRAARTLPQKDVAARFGKAPSTISQSLGAAGLEAIQAGEATLALFLDRFVPAQWEEPAKNG